MAIEISTDESNWIENDHPGLKLYEDFMEPHGITAYRLSKATGLPQSRISDLVKGKRGITPETAYRLGKAFGTTTEFWLNMQSVYDALETRRRHAKDTVEIPCLVDGRRAA